MPSLAHITCQVALRILWGLRVPELNQGADLPREKLLEDFDEMACEFKVSIAF
ncbi:hypothetical protein CY34DRAFT_814101 [Suillus luteus UH-Slu-Lm8-n1]|uniref:Uncharacterized protein n=1 Tax=Suillus luteus UH-Slu-Lm8-n1 TaxID=930992 RepID=A0A0C9Z5K4_9AGAM|nr:hypothetical protein CY34DRAFT_814101 [Suillus luteus UH-Slu-Lm8-n1]